MSSETIISLRNVSKTYRSYDHPLHRLVARISGGRIGHYKEFHALNDISFDIHKGETIGIIGKNGSGKSTLLQIICGIRQPTSGSVKVKGRISALLELGSGFQPEFTGRENVFLQGAIIGLTRHEMETRFDDIAAFADIGEYIDQPVKTYSSGMYVRLAFAVAISVDPDILVVDEALAVGDASFQAKCFRRINDIQERGGAILLVTHTAEQVAHFCSGAMLLDKGKVIASGGTAGTLARYVELLKSDSKENLQGQASPTRMPDESFHLHPAYNPQETRWGDHAATITGFRLVQDGRENPPAFMPGLPVELDLQVSFHADIERLIYGLAIKTNENAPILATNSRKLAIQICSLKQKDGDKITIRFTFHPFLDVGDYRISVGVASETPSGVLPHDRRYNSISLHVEHPISPYGDVDMRVSFECLERQNDCGHHPIEAKAEG